jgi:hypothetical protein
VNQQETAIRAGAERLFREKFEAAGWSEQDFGSFHGYCIEQAVIRIAAGGEPAAVQEIIGMHAGLGAMPRVDATGQVSHPLLDRCLEVIREARAATAREDGQAPELAGPGIQAITQARHYLATGQAACSEGDLALAVMELVAGSDADIRAERLALAGALIAVLIENRERDRA